MPFRSTFRRAVALGVNPRGRRDEIPGTRLHRLFRRQAATVVVLAWVVLGLGGFLQTASAQTAEETAAARSLAKQGVTAFNEERYLEAADFFVRAESLVHSPVHLLYEARARKRIGQFVKAQEAYIKILREDFSDDAPAVFHDAKRSAKSEIKELEGKLASLTVNLVGTETEAQVLLNGRVVPPALVGVAMPLDPGDYTLEATAEGFEPVASTVALTPGQSEDIELVLVPTKSEVPRSLPGLGLPEAAANAQPGADSARVPHAPNSELRLGSYVAFGVGALGLGVGTFFYLDGVSQADDANQFFDDNVTPDGTLNEAQADQLAALDDDADAAKNLGIVGFVAGGVGIAAGVTLWLLSGNSDSESSGLSVVPVVGHRSVGVVGSF